MYSTHKTHKELNQQLLVGLKKHLLIAQDTSQSKAKRDQSLTGLTEVLEYVINNINEACGPEEVAIYRAFFVKLLSSVVHAQVALHTKPSMFTDEIGFINILLQL